MLKKLYTAILLTVLCAGTALAQDVVVLPHAKHKVKDSVNLGETGFAHTNFYIGIPLAFAAGEFAETSPGTVAWGGSLAMMFPIKKSNFEVGFEYTFLNYANLRERNANYTLEGITVDGDRFRTFNMHRFLPTVGYRLPIRSKRLSPFINAQAGTRFVVTNHRFEVDIEDPSFSLCPKDTDVVDSRMEVSDWLFDLGVGAGVDIILEHAAVLTLRVGYQTTNPGNYANKNSFSDEATFGTDIKGGQSTQFLNSRMQLMTVDVGLKLFW